MSKLTDSKPPPKKRGRKPKGGKIINKTEKQLPTNQVITNVILHLKCKLSDINNDCIGGKIKYDPSVPSVEGTYTNNYKPSELSYEIINNCKEIIDISNNIDNNITENKLKQLQHSLHSNNLSNKKSACFWCTCPFDNHPVYIPKSYLKNKYNVYGNFCSPECAVAHLFNEHLDSSTKFERYNLFNHIYSKIYNYEKNIKPAPNPYYVLDKFLGNLTITEYRKLSSQEQLLFVMDKPITRIFPELHDDSDEFILDNKKKSTSSFF
jgi:hypothetical protein